MRWRFGKLKAKRSGSSARFLERVRFMREVHGGRKRRETRGIGWAK